MRNLKKILALVLALVMSLSLMATASAADFKDASSISDTYETAVEVLSGLGVFNGYKEDGTFRPQGSITRAETAAIIYRIVTGDVEDKQVGIYADYNIFTDVPSSAWYAGYVNFCANAEYIKGVGGGKFNPQGQVTGYAALAMILRAIGYTANGGFTGSDWAVQTARTAESRKITKNINTGLLGEPANRETVAEILFQAILVNMVDHNVLSTLNGDQGYFEKDETLGYKTFKLEGYEGVVVANEFANLNDSQVLAEGKTQMQAEGEANVRTLNITTKITDIGESRIVYTQNVSKVLSIADTGLNTTKEYGAAVDILTDAKFRDAAGMNPTRDTEYYINFEPTGYWTSDWRIEYTIWLPFYSDADALAYVNGSNSVTANGGTIYTNATGTNAKDGPWLDTDNVPFYYYWYTKAIKAGDPITQADMANMYKIFIESNGIHGPTVDQILPWNEWGQVFVATQTKVDISDTLSYNEFREKYINDISVDKNWNTSDNGEWVKFIDNDGDGNAEYAFKTQYALTEAVSSYTNKAGDTVMQYSWDQNYNRNADFRAQNFDDDDHTYATQDYTVRYMKDDEAVERDVAVGDIVLAAWIDNQYLVSHAESVTTQSVNYNYKADEMTAADGNTYGQSGIWNITTMQNLIASMAPKTTYEMFLDKFGYVRAYRLPGGTQYALVTELYFTNNAQGNLVQDWPMTVELVMPNEDGTLIKKEYNLVNRTNNELRGLVAWGQVSNLAQTSNYYNWLQPAIAHLGVTWTGMTPVREVPTLGNANLTYWPNSLQMVRPITSFNGSTEFNYGAQNYIGRDQANYNNPVPVTNTTSFTNVAEVSIDGDNATIHGAAKVRLNNFGQATGQPNAGDYAVDYIQLTRKNVAAGAASFEVASGSAVAYNRVVNADKDTEIYVIYDGGVKYFKGYSKMPALNADTVGSIHAAYAVARNTTTGTGGAGVNYWIANVLVFEVEKWDDLKDSSLSLAYYTFNQSVQSASSVTIDTLNNKSNPAKVQLVPSTMAWNTGDNWWDNWGYNTKTGFGWKTSADTGNGYGFYRLYNDTAAVDGVMTAAAIEKITEKYSKAGIYVGTVTREIDLATSSYIPVNMTGTLQDGKLKTEALLSIASGKVYSITWAGDTNETSYKTYYEANDLWFNNTVYSNVKANDKIIWVGGGTKGTTPNSASFIVDLGSNTNGTNNLVDNTALWNRTATWLKNLWTAIDKDQNPVVNHDNEWKIGVIWCTDDTDQTQVNNTKVDDEATFAYVEKGKGWSVKADDLGLDGYNIVDVKAIKTGGAIETPADNVAVTDQAALMGQYGITAAALTTAASDITVIVKVAVATYSLNVEGDGTCNAATATVSELVEALGDARAPASGVLTTSGITNAGLQKNSPFKIVTGAPSAVDKELSVKSSVKVSDLKVEKDATTGALTITGKITGAATIIIQETAKKFAIDISTASDKVTNITVAGTDVTNGTYASGANKAVSTWASAADATITVTTAAGYQIDPATVEVKVGGVAVANTAANYVVNAAAGTIDLKDGGACDKKDVTVTFGVRDAQYAISAVTTDDGKQWSGTISCSLTPNAGTPVTFTADTPVSTGITAKTTDTVYIIVTGAYGAVNIVASTGTVTGPQQTTNNGANNSYYYELTGVTGATTITVKQP